MTVLAFLPETIIAAILDQGTSVGVINLWFSGDRVMQHKLATGIAKIKLLDPLELTSSRFPKFLTELRSLRELTIDRHGGVMPYYRDIPQFVRCLPPTLMKLKLRVRDAVEILRPPMANHARKSSATAHPPIENNIAQHPWTFAAAFPLLVTLELKFGKTWSINDFALLPSSLTSLSIPSGLKRLSGDFSSAIPRQLLALELCGFPIVLQPFWVHLPPHLTKLAVKLARTSDSNISLKHLPYLTQLTRCSLDQTLMLADVPSGLVYLDMSWFTTPYDIAELKRFTNLKEITDLLLSPQVNELLPPTVQIIDLAKVDSAMESIKWPTSLTELHVELKDETAFHFPSSLIKLEIVSLLDLSMVSTFPRMLSSLAVGAGLLPESCATIDFPPLLTFLSISLCSNHPGWLALEENTFETAADSEDLDDDSQALSRDGKKVLHCFPYHKLPQSIRHLQVSAIVPASQLKYLPPRLTHLGIQDIFRDADFHPKDALEMSAMHNLSKIGVAEGILEERSDWSQLTSASIPTLLPRTLTTLTAWADSMVLLISDWREMPPNLTSLWLHPSDGLPITFLDQMPMKSITCLDVALNGAEDHHLKLLPKHLREGGIQFQNSPNLTPNAFVHIRTDLFRTFDTQTLDAPLNMLRTLQTKHAGDEDPTVFLRYLKPDQDIIKEL